jgi:hypothetical protein
LGRKGRCRLLLLRPRSRAASYFSNLFFLLNSWGVDNPNVLCYVIFCENFREFLVFFF